MNYRQRPTDKDLIINNLNLYLSGLPAEGQYGPQAGLTLDTAFDLDTQIWVLDIGQFF